ncbi:hypothetical protein RJ640_010896 [Escallonia rubra]|uniref:Tryptophan/tyrosine permease n=1 Tax=Escallonia rubra TaxID=112253 RepID=A0AA88U5S2_9ASTE|nr:hypothetical protein RJ640_010896 [Escallonia rubra]
MARGNGTATVVTHQQYDNNDSWWLNMDLNKIKSDPTSTTLQPSRTRTYHAHVYCRLQRERSPQRSRKVYLTQGEKCLAVLKEEPIKVSKKKGTIVGAVALIIGTSIGSGILALPKETTPAGLLPSSISLTICWVFLLIEALLLVEINVELLKKKKKIAEGNELEVISIRTMAQETLGEWGGSLATVTYVFLGYTSMIAYSSKSGEILYHLINLPESVSGILFTTLFTILISVGGTRATAQVNQWLTASMIVLCAYLGGDLRRIRTSVLLGSIVPLLALLVWDAIAIGLSSQADQFTDPVELLTRVKWSGVPVMVEAFSLLAVGTSLIGTLLSFSQFFKEQLTNLTSHSPSRQISEKPREDSGTRKWWTKNKVNFTATAIVIAPSLLVSTTVPDVFSAATDIAGGAKYFLTITRPLEQGGYCMTMLYGVLPPAMAWAMYGNESKNADQKGISRARPALLGVGLFAFAVVVEQILQDLTKLQS